MGRTPTALMELPILTSLFLSWFPRRRIVSFFASFSNYLFPCSLKPSLLNPCSPSPQSPPSCLTPPAAPTFSSPHSSPSHFSCHSFPSHSPSHSSLSILFVLLHLHRPPLVRRLNFILQLLLLLLFFLFLFSYFFSSFFSLFSFSPPPPSSC